MEHIDLTKLFNHHPYAELILKKLTDSGHQAVIVGGAVRDIVRSRFFPGYDFDPKKTDIDIATSAGLKVIQEILPDLKFIDIGKDFGVLIAVSPDGKEYEIAQFRRESEYDGRKPRKVEPASSLKEDIKRRDFTVNGLAVTKEGKVYDYVNGISDLKEKIIRAIGDPYNRFHEDYLRPLRGIRISASLGGYIESDTYRAIMDASSRITEISWERIRDELFNILETGRAGQGLRICQDVGLLKEILPEMSENAGIPQSEKYHPEGDVLEHSFQALEVADLLDFPPSIKLATFIHDVGKARSYKKNNKQHFGGHELIGEKLASQIARRLHLSNRQTKKVRWLVGNHMKGSILPKMKRAKQVKLVRYNQDKSFSIDNPKKRFNYFSGLLGVIIADSEASAHGASGWIPILECFSSLLPHLQELEDLGTARKIFDGNDLKDLGLTEGPLLGEVLEEVHEAIYAGNISSHDQAIHYARNLIRNLEET